MRAGFWSGKVLREEQLWKLLAEVESVWGVHVHVTLCCGPEGKAGRGTYISVDLPEEIHRSELCNPPTLVVPVMDLRMVRMEVQLNCALAQWVDLVSEHLKAEGRPH
jgi:hypothetical protein